MCIDVCVCTYFKSQTVRFNTASFGIENSTPPSQFDEVEIIKKVILQESVDTVEVRVVAVRVAVHRVMRGTVVMIEMGWGRIGWGRMGWIICGAHQ